LVSEAAVGVGHDWRIAAIDGLRIFEVFWVGQHALIARADVGLAESAR